MATEIVQRTYLKSVHFSGFKSVKDVKVEFQRGLNIIIGKNAAGKTNFLTFLNKSLAQKFEDVVNFHSSLVFQNGKQITIETTRSIDSDNILDFKSDVSPESILKIGKKVIRTKDGESNNKKLEQNNIKFQFSFLCHGIPSEYLFIQKPASFKYNKDLGFSEDLFALRRSIGESFYMHSIISEFFAIGFMKERVALNFNEKWLKKELENSFKKLTSFKEVIIENTPIQDFRFSDNYRININSDDNSFEVSNLVFEFYIDGGWYPFSSLSDGTKRLFYIISEVCYDDFNSSIKSSNLGFTIKEAGFANRIILIEEPELGIHPHQFDKLLNILREESQTKQIIITSHSPQVLNKLDSNELNRIIIAYTNNDKKGTQLRHLNNDELLKAKEYIEEDFLSDYWLHSDLEKTEI